MVLLHLVDVNGDVEYGQVAVLDRKNAVKTPSAGDAASLSRACGGDVESYVYDYVRGPLYGGGDPVYYRRYSISCYVKPRRCPLDPVR